ncbi:ion transporter [Solimonas soli]|uniref:ion transporter n=1 Tax=Solimonas soli TaxID=413479 RepID=UPI00047F8B6A|nr:ion transporter [Solimonas soli]
MRTERPTRHRITAVDWLMLLLAIVSIALLGYETWGPVTADERREIYIADMVICAIFAIEFLWRWHAQGWRWNYLTRNWYELLGMIPAAHPAIRGFRLFRIIRIAVLLSRFGGAADRALGEDFTYLLVNRFKDTIVDSISDAVAVAVLEEVADVLGRGTYTRNIARALKENEADLRQMLVDKLRADPRAGRLSRLPFYKDISEAMIDSGFRIVEEVLADPRTDELVADMMRENLAQLRTAIIDNNRPAAA